MKSAMSLCLLLWRQHVNLWRNRRGHEGRLLLLYQLENGKCIIYHLTWHWHILVCGLLPSCRWGYRFPNAKVNLALKWETRSKIGPAPEIPCSISNFQQVRESGP
ncbi:hypothetical protein PVAP13_3NG020090 [Panicum virgatum]|uniref:Uncharacterized protein n=1 Tax=Panicum virgatum TaxID=38727 RepID=A0A8T0TVW1_PANVG|nr:hypothetical protein PVAP13_3NG020090 [Panicum virgatum]